MQYVNLHLCFSMSTATYRPHYSTQLNELINFADGKN